MHSGERLVFRVLWFVMLFLVVAGSLLPGSAPALRAVDWIPDKFLHLTGYLVLGMLPAIRERPRTILAAVAFVCVLGIGLEYAQAWMHAGRMFEVRDMAANALGASAGAVIGWVAGDRGLRALLSSPGSATGTSRQRFDTDATSRHTLAPGQGSPGVPARKPSARQPVYRDRPVQARPDAARRT